MSRIHRRPPSYNFAASLLNSGLTNSSPITLNTVRDHVAANGGNRLVIGSEFNRLTETVRQMKIRQESTAQQMQLLRAENQVMYRQLTQMRGQLEQQGQLIQTVLSLFNITCFSYSAFFPHLQQIDGALVFGLAQADVNLL